jgi:hypothetical protein
MNKLDISMNSKSMNTESKFLILAGIVIAVFTLFGYKLSSSYFTANGVIGAALIWNGFSGMCYLGLLMAKLAYKDEKSCPYHYAPQWSYSSLNSWRKNRVLIGGSVLLLTLLGFYVSHVFFAITGVLGAILAIYTFMNCSHYSEEACKTCETTTTHATSKSLKAMPAKAKKTSVAKKTSAAKKKPSKKPAAKSKK